MRVLFSPVGNTDPVKTKHDGGMLHICRKYKPDKIYLYLSKEMCEFNDGDQRYTKAIELLGKEIGQTFDVKLIPDEEMENVQIFGEFIDKFEKILKDIRAEDNPDELIVNVSSGTPAMKSALQIISLLQNNICAVQVSTPLLKGNFSNKDYNLDEEWEKNEDRKENCDDRCIVSTARPLLDRIIRENIEKYIDEYDYEAAKIMAGTLSDSGKPSDIFNNCLDMAIERKKLNLKYVNEHRNEYDTDGWFPVERGREMKEFEYLLAMQIKLKKKQYVDFVRDVTPIFFSLSETLLKKCCNLSFNDIGYKYYKNNKDKCGTWNLKIAKLQKENIEPDNRWDDRTFISPNIIYRIMTKKHCDNSVLELMGEIRSVEEKVRNLAAHDIVSVTSEWIEKRTGFTPEQIMDKCFELAEYSGIDISGRDAYDRMNNNLKALLHDK